MVRGLFGSCGPAAVAACVVCLVLGAALDRTWLANIALDQKMGRPPATAVKETREGEDSANTPAPNTVNHRQGPSRSVAGMCHTDIAVLFTFHAGKQLDEAATFLGQLTRLQPCSQAQATLVVFTETDAATQRARDRFDAELRHPRVRQCFPRVEFLSAQLSQAQDTYPTGATLQFHAALDQMQGRFAYTLLLEPDVHIMHEYWIDALCNVIETYERLIGDNEGPWVIGSVPRASGVRYNKPLSHRLHINGNAVYNTHSAIFAGVRHSVRTNAFQNKQDASELRSYQTSKQGRAYDVDLASFLYHSKHFSFVQQHFHRFIASPFIQNRWRGKWSASTIREESPATYLIHGGTPAP